MEKNLSTIKAINNAAGRYGLLNLKNQPGGLFFSLWLYQQPYDNTKA